MCAHVLACVYVCVKVMYVRNASTSGVRVLPIACVDPFAHHSGQRKASEIECSSWKGSKISKRVLRMLQRYVLYGV